ncbi:MAG: DUF4453 domain-containing protein [Pseudomonadota bacterium]
MRRALLFAWALLGVALATPAAAQDGCDDLWFTRNLVFDRAGYCFGSALGQATFDNSDCVGKSVALDPASERLVNEVKRLESVFGCRVDTSRRQLSAGDWAIRRQLAELPIRDEFESACLRYLGAPRALHAAPWPGSAIVGRIDPSNDVSYAHYGLDGGVYVRTYTGASQFAAPLSGGWLLQPLGETDCAQWAG